MFLTLVYLHNLPTFQMLGVQFDIGESTANYIFHRWVKILRELLPAIAPSLIRSASPFSPLNTSSAKGE
ncbi:MAG: helix-turn-helix domain-containing protein [Microcoleus sp.]